MIHLAEKYNKVAMAIHGGAGTILPENLDEQTEADYRRVLETAVRSGHEVLRSGCSSIDAVVTAISVMEDSPLFNAGKGAVFTHAGKNELDASIMEGKDLQAGAVAAVTRIRNPIKLACEVMMHSKHVMLLGDGAQTFARSRGMKLVGVDYFYTERRWLQLQKAQQQGAAVLSESAGEFGTVGAVALDKDGNIAAGTSTGGMTNMRFGRVGDSPIIGAGTYADNSSCGISATGHGEYLIRAVVAYDICARRSYKGVSLQQAADEVVLGQLKEMGGEGGIIGIDTDGNIVHSFNSAGMYRAKIDSKGNLAIDIFH